MSTESFIGRWRIVDTEVWDAAQLARGGAAELVIEESGYGSLSFAGVRGDVDWHYRRLPSGPVVEFTFAGEDDGGPTSGRGWATLAGHRLRGQLFVHRGDAGAFAAVPLDRS